MRTTPIRLLAELTVFASALFLVGCAAQPCDGKHGGICTSPRLVWGITRNRDQVNPTKQTLRDQNRADKLLHSPPSKKDVLPSISESSTVFKEPSAAVSVGSSGQRSSVAGPLSPTGQMPLLTQPKVIRVWIAPWSHENTLHFPGYVYRVVQPEQWRFAPSGGTTPVPVP